VLDGATPITSRFVDLVNIDCPPTRLPAEFVRFRRGTGGLKKRLRDERLKQVLKRSATSVGGVLLRCGEVATSLVRKEPSGVTRA